MKKERATRDEADSKEDAAAHNPLRHLYVHFPFCAKICPYCAFYKTRGTAAEFADFCTALMTEAGSARKNFPLALETIFFGGGTPSAHSTAQLEMLLAHLAATFDLRTLTEWTIEVNPGSVSAKKAEALRRGGITRISLGVQSWNDDLLRLLGREHDARQAEESFRIFRKANFENISIDLMFSLPGQTEGQWRDTLARTIALQPEHVSTYCLTYEEDTEFLARFQRGDFTREDENEARFLEIAMETLTGAGYEQYEISNYARPGFRSRHNEGYWRGDEYLGLGPSAFSTVNGRRWQNVPDIRAYAERLRKNESPVDRVELLSAAMKRTERIALGLRTRDGLPAAMFAPEETEPLVAGGFLTRRKDRIALTARGRLVADSIAEELV